MRCRAVCKPCRRSSQFTASANRPLQFHKRCQLFIAAHNETLSVATVSVNNPLDAVIRVYDESGNVIETQEHKGDFKEW